MDLVVGSTGLLGFEICCRLTSAGKPLKALVRSTSDAGKLETLKGAGARLVYGDLRERPTLDACCQGVTTVISTASSTFSHQPGDSIATVDHQGQLNLIEAAKAAGVRHFVFVSFPPAPGDFALQRAKRAVEGRLKASGLAYTVLQPTFFTEIWLSPAVGFDFANARARVYGSGNNKTSWISYLDVAAFAAASIENPAARNAVVELGGPEALSPLEVVKIFEELGGRQFAVEHVPEAALRAQKAGATEALEEAYAALMLYYAQGDVIDMKEANRIFPSLAGRQASVQDCARRALGHSPEAEAARA
ncbi:MAG TPA: SDR family oxidoreductase [Terriglobia bacterium]